MLAVVPAALIMSACGGSVGHDSVTGPAVAAVSEDAAVLDAVTESGKTATTSLCHKGRDKMVAPSAVAGHLRHGDSLGSCSAPVDCPCFSADSIQFDGGQCSVEPTPLCDLNDQPYLLLTCSPGSGTGGSTNTSIYLSQTSGGGYCSRTDRSGFFEQDGLTSNEYDSCVEALAATEYCG